MKFEETFPMSYESFKVFRPTFETCSEDSKLHLFKSKEGRLNCLKTVAYSPLTAPGQLIRRVCDLVKSLMEALSKVFEMVEHRQKDIPALKKSIKNLADYALVVVSSPVTIIAERVRYLVGVIHPRVVYKPETSVVTAVIAAVDEGKEKVATFGEKVKEVGGKIKEVGNNIIETIKDAVGADKKEKTNDDKKANVDEKEKPKANEPKVEKDDKKAKTDEKEKVIEAKKKEVKKDKIEEKPEVKKEEVLEPKKDNKKEKAEAKKEVKKDKVEDKNPTNEAEDPSDHTKSEKKKGNIVTNLFKKKDKGSPKSKEPATVN